MQAPTRRTAYSDSTHNHQVLNRLIQDWWSLPTKTIYHLIELVNSDLNSAAQQ